MVEDVPLLATLTNEEDCTRLPGGHNVKSKKQRKLKKQNAKTISISMTQSGGPGSNAKQPEANKKAKNTRKNREDDIKKKKQIVEEHSRKKGLSPPKDDGDKESNSNHSVKTSNTQGTSRVAPMIGIFDDTQWERTRFSKEAALDNKKFPEMVKLPENEEAEKKADAPLLGETRQKTVVRGEYLTEKPKVILTLLGIEVVWSVVCIFVWSAAADNPLMPLMLAIFNLLIIFLLILACLSVEFFRLQVRREDTKVDTRYLVPYLWRYSICEAHIARAILLCANITIMVFDNDFDIGSIIVLALTPFHLIIVAIHIFLAFKPYNRPLIFSNMVAKASDFG